MIKSYSNNRWNKYSSVRNMTPFWLFVSIWMPVSLNGQYIVDKLFVHQVPQKHHTGHRSVSKYHKHFSKSNGGHWHSKDHCSNEQKSEWYIGNFVSNDDSEGRRVMKYSYQDKTDNKLMKMNDWQIFDNGNRKLVNRLLPIDYPPNNVLIYLNHRTRGERSNIHALVKKEEWVDDVG